MTPPNTFETDRLFARRPRREDAPAVFAAYASDPEVTKYLCWKVYTDIEPLADFLEMHAGHWKNENGNYAYMLCLRDTDIPIGSIRVLIEKHQTMFGYVLGREHWGQGYMTEALRFLLNWTMDQPEIYRAWAFCDVDNPASARVMDKAGMTREGVFRRYHIAPNISPEPRDCIVCAKVR